MKVKYFVDTYSTNCDSIIINLSAFWFCNLVFLILKQNTNFKKEWGLLFFVYHHFVYVCGGGGWLGMYCFIWGGVKFLFRYCGIS